MKTIKIFIASSSELKDDRDLFRNFISQENDRLHTKGIYLEIVQWENFLDAVSNTRLQDEYNNAIRECDIVLCLFFTKVGKYTAEEFDTAYELFKAEGKPKIWTYFKNAQINLGSITDEINTLLAFKKKIGDLGHFFTEYNNIDNLINKYRTQLDKFLPQFEEDTNTSNPRKNDGKGQATILDSSRRAQITLGTTRIDRPQRWPYQASSLVWRHSDSVHALARRFLCLAGHRHEAHGQHRAPFDFSSPLFQQIEILGDALADGNDHPPAFLELLHEWLRHMVGRAGHDDRVEGRMLRPALETVAGLDLHIFKPEPSQVRAGQQGEWLDDLDAENLRDEL